MQMHDNDTILPFSRLLFQCSLNGACFEVLFFTVPVICDCGFKWGLRENRPAATGHFDLDLNLLRCGLRCGAHCSLRLRMRLRSTAADGAVSLRTHPPSSSTPTAVAADALWYATRKKGFNALNAGAVEGKLSILVRRVAACLRTAVFS